MAGADADDPDGPTARIERDALLPLIERSSRSSGPARTPGSSRPAPAYVRTVPREHLRPRADVEVVHVAPLQRLPARARGDRDFDEPAPSVSPLLVLGIIALLIVTFIAATQLR